MSLEFAIVLDKLQIFLYTKFGRLYGQPFAQQVY